MMRTWFPLPILLAFLASVTSVGATVNKRCPANMTSLPVGMSACNFPNIVTNQRGCGRARNETWTYRLCDPNYMMTYDDAWAMEEAIRQAEVTSPFTCYDVRDAMLNFTYGFAILESISIPDLNSPEVCINHCGAIMPELKDRNPTEEEVTVALETLTKAVVKQWSLGYCGNDVITVYSKEHKRALTLAGSKATALTTARLQSLTAGAVDYYLQRGQLRAGLTYLLNAYKQTLLGFSPAYVLLAITGGLLVFLLAFLYFVFNVGRNVNTLYDESLPTTTLKLLLYAVSLIWLVKAWIVLLGWMLDRPKVRVVYVTAPMALCLLGVTIAWMSSPPITGGLPRGNATNTS